MLLPVVVIIIHSAFVFTVLFGHCIAVGVLPDAIIELHVLWCMPLCLLYGGITITYCQAQLGC